MGAKEVVTAALERAAARDAQGLGALMSEDVVIHLAGTSPLAGVHKGREGFARFFGGLQELTDRTITPQVHQILGEGTHAVALLTISAQREGRSATWSQVNVYHVEGDLISEVWIIPQDLYAVDAFLG